VLHLLGAVRAERALEAADPCVVAVPQRGVAPLADGSHLKRHAERIRSSAMQPIDLRSDTVTRPTPAMREAMATAEVGDDVWGDDPTVIELEREVAAVLGKQAALYVPSGTMGNQIAIRCQTRPGDEILVHELAHVIVHEAGGVAALSSVQTRMIAGERGLPGPDQLEPWLRDPADEHHARQHLICIENTIGEQGGLIFPQDRIDAIAAFAHERGMRLHMDGARLWNAAVAGGATPRGSCATSTPSRSASRRGWAPRSGRSSSATPS